MELDKSYTGIRYEIVCPETDNKTVLHAAEAVWMTVKQYVPYMPELVKAPTGRSVPLFVGTRHEGVPALSADETYYSVGEDGSAVICGGSPASVLYAAESFCDDYITEVRRNRKGHSFFVNPFADKLPPCEKRARPLISERGLWTWGHVIYDYRGYIRNMARLKLNKITVWNDFAPVNAAEFVSYAHEYGISVVWGYSWCWGNKVNISDRGEMLRWAETAKRVYKEQYEATGADGIYFQMFTETADETADGVSIAEKAVEWVNFISSGFFEEYPDLRIEFGLHATSVKSKLDIISKTDSRVTIVWEDCGSFPYAYGAGNMSGADATADFTDKISSLRGGKGFGAVLKGNSNLDWGLFEHQNAPCLIGVSSEAEIAEKTALRRDIYRYQGAYWLKNGGYALETVRRVAANTGGDCVIEDLVEDGMFDRHIYLSAALFAEMCWDGESDFNTLLSAVYKRGYTDS